MIKNRARSDAHRDQAERNQSFARDVVEEAPDWSTTVAFYSALHFVQQYAVARGEDIIGHEQRARFLIARGDLRRIRRTYDKLKGFATITRYDCPPEDHFLRDPEKVRVIVFPLLGEVNRCIDLAIRRLCPDQG